jgi:TolB-like protein
MGQVYLATDARHDRKVAVKVMKPACSSVVGSQRFLREIRIAAQLSHPNIVPVFDSDEVDGRPFYVMPFIEGENLRQHLSEETMLPVEQVIRWGVEVCEGLMFLHSHGIVHRDIKPENLLVQADRLLISDFGLARALDRAVDTSMSSEQVVLGTPTYMSPEQATGSAKIDGRSDVYALGCVLYEMLAGEPPFDGATPQSITSKKVSAHYPPLSIVRPAAGRALEAVIAAALQPNPADRTPTAEVLRDGLLASAGPARHPFRLRVGIVASAAALIALGGGIAYTRLSRPTALSPAPPRLAVARFENRTGDARVDPLGFMAADWITEGVQRTAEVDVVPAVTALAAVTKLHQAKAPLDLVGGLAGETGARLVLTGAIYRESTDLIFQAQLADAKDHKLVGALDPVRVADSAPSEALQELRSRVMGLLALSLDHRVILAERPPTFAAYQAFSEGMDAYVRNDYAPALKAFQRAAATDSTFVLPLLYASFCYSNDDDYASADSLLDLVNQHRDRLNAYDQSWLDYRLAELAGDDARSLAAIRRAAEIAPSSKATYNFAVQALEARRPFLAESALAGISPDVGSMRGWLPYWDVLASALHVQDKHRLELKAAREAYKRFPYRLDGYRLEARALAATLDEKGLQRLWSEAVDRSHPSPPDAAALAIEIAKELWEHGDTNAALGWFNRAYGWSGSERDPSITTEALWVKAEASAGLGRLREAADQGKRLVAANPGRLEFAGFAGVLAARLGERERSDSILTALAGISRPYTYGRPQFQAARIAAALGELDRSAELLTSAYAKGLPYDLEFHRDRALIPLKGRPILHELDVRLR